MQKKDIKPLAEAYAVRDRFNPEAGRHIVISTDLVELTHKAVGAGRTWRKARAKDRPRNHFDYGYDRSYVGYLVAPSPEGMEFPTAEAEALAAMIRHADPGDVLPIEKGELQLTTVIPREIISTWDDYQAYQRVEERARTRRHEEQERAERERQEQLARVRDLSERAGVPTAELHYGFLSDGVKLGLPAYLDLLERLILAEARVKAAYDSIAEDGQ